MQRWIAQAFLAAQLPGSIAFASDLALPPSSSSPSDLPLIAFSIKPKLCVLNAEEETCHDELQVTWRAPEQRSLCLYQADKTEPLQCWQAETQGTYTFELNTRASTDFQLREAETDEALGDQRFHVVYQDKKFRRARRNPWSFF